MRLASIFTLSVALLLPAAPVMPEEAASGSSHLPSSPPAINVLELYTSQGCDSCPPADDVLSKFAERANVIALTMPVDIWDYLGWKDTLATEKNSERQRVYAKTRGDGAIYTPQIIVNGMIGVMGSDARAVEQAISTTNQALYGARIPIRFWHDRNTLKVEAGAAPAGHRHKEATVWFAVVQKRAEVPIEQGENKGKTIVYTNVVREMLPVGSWNGEALSLQLTRTAVMRPETDAAVVLLQEGKAGPIIGAAWMGLW